MDKVRMLTGYSFDWKTGFEKIHSNTGHDIGIMADDLEKVLPELVTKRSHGYKAIKYDKLVALLIEAIKEQDLKIQALENKTHH
jgi:hypothetical protein